MNTYPKTEETQFSRRSGLYTVIFVGAILSFVASALDLYQSWIADDVSLVNNGIAILGVFFSLFYTLIYINQPE